MPDWEDVVVVLCLLVAGVDLAYGEVPWHGQGAEASDRVATVVEPAELVAAHGR